MHRAATMALFVHELSHPQSAGLPTRHLDSQGRVVVFDDSFSHSVDFEPAPPTMAPPHPLDGVRVVLVVDLWHPQASRWFPEERRLRCKPQGKQSQWPHHRCLIKAARTPAAESC